MAESCCKRMRIDSTSFAIVDANHSYLIEYDLVSNDGTDVVNGRVLYDGVRNVLTIRGDKSMWDVVSFGGFSRLRFNCPDGKSIDIKSSVGPELSWISCSTSSGTKVIDDVDKILAGVGDDNDDVMTGRGSPSEDGKFAGQIYSDSLNGKVYVWLGSEWADVSGEGVLPDATAQDVGKLLYVDSEGNWSKSQNDQISDPSNFNILGYNSSNQVKVLDASVLAKASDVALNEFSTKVECGKVTFSSGAISSNGQIVSSTTRVVCNETFESIDVCVPDGYLIHSVAYYSSYTRPTQFVLSSFSSIGKSFAHLHKDGCVLKFTIRKEDSSEISVDDVITLAKKYSCVSFDKVESNANKIESNANKIENVFADKIYEQTISAIAGTAVNAIFNVELVKGTFVQFNLDGDVYKNGNFVRFYDSSNSLLLESVLPSDGVIPVSDSISSCAKVVVSIGGSAIYSTSSLKVAVLNVKKNTANERAVVKETVQIKPSLRDGVFVYFYSGIKSNPSNSWNSCVIDVSSYSGMTLRHHMKCQSRSAAKSFFVDENLNLISYITNDGNIVDTTIPTNAKYLAISNRSEDVPNPLFYVVGNEEKNKYVHFSLDDVSGILQNLVDNENSYSSIFDEPKMALLKQWHDNYGIKVSLFVQRTMSDIPEKFKYEIIANKNWIKWGYHGKNNDLANANYEQAKTIWNGFVDGVMSSIGNYDVIDRCPRLDYFHCTLEGAKGLRDANCGVLGLLSCDDWSYNKATRATNYYLTDEQSTWLDKHDKLVDNENQLTIVKTDFRLEQIIQRWSNTENCISDYSSANRANESFYLEIFSHENLFAQYTTEAPKIFGWCLQNGYKFEFPMNLILGI